MGGKPIWILIIAAVLLLIWLAACRRSAKEAGSAGGDGSGLLPVKGAGGRADAAAASADDPSAGDSRPPGASRHAEARRAMVLHQIEQPRDGRTPVRSQAVLEAMRAVPRHAFVPPELEAEAHADCPLPIGHGQTISQPYIVARMTELLGLEPDSKILEIGTGSGYQAAVLAEITPHVYTIEIVEPLAERARTVLREQGYGQVKCRAGDGYLGWEEEAPFDGIIVTCAPEDLPPPLWEQLKPGGRIVIPIGEAHGLQRLELVTKTQDGERRTELVEWVRFVPLTRQQEP
ncbi:MAG: protein-L-isoaspartate(D-aspartate) O-methyltransferase [Planctomycetes bacterium]|nr:protein-L-isoaspartate(D-aspartate) O-methyltransferase [Planctomycetota bacterium]